MEYCLAVRRNEVLVCTTTQMNLENTMPSESSQTQNLMYSMTSFT